MNRKLRILLASTAMALALPAMAQAEIIPSPIEMSGGNITAAQIEQGLTALGYTDITYIQGAGAYYTVRAHHDGRYLPLLVDANTGAVSRMGDPDMQTISMHKGTMDQHLIEGLEEIGYSNVTIKSKAGNVATASGARYGEVAELTIDLNTGRVTNNSQDETWYVAMHEGMSDADIGAGLEAMGYTEVHEVRFGQGGWTGRAMQDGQKVDVWVDSYSGEIRTWPTGTRG